MHFGKGHPCSFLLYENCKIVYIEHTFNSRERERERERERGLYVYRHKSFRSYNATSTNLQQVQQAWAHKWA